MTAIWQNLLHQQSSLASITNVNANHYFAPLPQLEIIQVTGSDAASFLQNLLTNDVTALAPNQAQLTGLCTAKGRLLAIFLLIRQQQGFHIIAPKSMCDLIQQRLTMYVLRSDVTLSNEKANLFCIVWNTTAQPLTNTIPKIAHPNDEHRFLSICDSTNIEDLIGKFEQENLELASHTIWEQRDINLGLAMIWPESKEKFTPQQVNLDLVNGVSFSKGCYPGQEVVARLHYLGKPSRRLFIAEAKTDLLPNIADEVTTDDDSIAGHIVSAQLIDGTVTLLLSLKLTSSSTSLLLKDGSLIKVWPSNLFEDE